MNVEPFAQRGGVLVIVGVVPPLWVCETLPGLGEEGVGMDWCFAMSAIFFRRVDKRVRTIPTTIFDVRLIK